VAAAAAREVGNYKARREAGGCVGRRNGGAGRKHAIRKAVFCSVLVTERKQRLRHVRVVLNRLRRVKLPLAAV
jgi:hypothetical protein